jgi:hypothetical protein
LKVGSSGEPNRNQVYCISNAIYGTNWALFHGSLMEHRILLYGLVSYEKLAGKMGIHGGPRESTN